MSEHVKYGSDEDCGLFASDFTCNFFGADILWLYIRI